MEKVAFVLKDLQYVMQVFIKTFNIMLNTYYFSLHFWPNLGAHSRFLPNLDAHPGFFQICIITPPLCNDFRVP